MFDDEDMEEEEDPECSKVKISKEEKIRLHNLWRCSLIIKVLGRRVGYMYLCKRLHTLWHLKAKMGLVAEYILIVQFY